MVAMVGEVQRMDGYLRDTMKCDISEGPSRANPSCRAVVESVAKTFVNSAGIGVWFVATDDVTCSGAVRPSRPSPLSPSLRVSLSLVVGRVARWAGGWWLQQLYLVLVDTHL